jgi:hypothetical protein
MSPDSETSASDSTSTDGPWTFVHASTAVTCGIRDELADCWTDWEAFPLDSVPSGTVAEIGAGTGWGCVTAASDGHIECWGEGATGGETDAPDGGGWHDLDVARDVACALDAEGLPRCWGDWGLREDPPETTPPPTVPLLDLSVGDNFACGRRSEDEILCWGRESSGPHTLVPSPVEGPFLDVAVGAAHGCAVRFDDRIVCWGTNDFGESDGSSSLPFAQASAGPFSSCGLAVDGRIRCWGNVPQLEWEHQGEFATVSAGAGYACGLTHAGEIECAGSCGSGECTVPE